MEALPCNDVDPENLMQEKRADTNANGLASECSGLEAIATVEP
jgi:hypothetical protein